jgi:restriction endonuclease S subunit
VYALRNGSLSKAISGTAQPQITRQSLTAISIPLPPLPEQKRIAEILDRAEALRAKRRAALAQLDTLTQSIFLDLFGDPESNPKAWRFARLGEVCDLLNGVAFKSTDYVEQSNTLNCRMSNIRPSGEFDSEYNPKYLPDKFAEKYKDHILKDGDVIIAMTDMATEPKILGVPTTVISNGKTFLLNQRVGKLTIESPESLLFPFLNRLLFQPYVKRYYQRFAGGGVQINLGKSDLLSVGIILPPLSLQQEFARRAAAVEKLRTAHRQSLAELDALFAALQHRAFQGEL